MLFVIIGATAAVLTMLSFVPQIIKVLNTKSAKDLSIGMLVQLSLGVTLWIVYGVYRKDLILITANSVTLTTIIILLWLYFFYERSVG